MESSPLSRAHVLSKLAPFTIFRSCRDDESARNEDIHHVACEKNNDSCVIQMSSVMEKLTKIQEYMIFTDNKRAFTREQSMISQKHEKSHQV